MRRSGSPVLVLLLAGGSLLLTGCPASEGVFVDRSTKRGAAGVGMLGLAAAAPAAAHAAGAAFSRDPLVDAASGDGLLFIRHPTSNRLLFADEATGRWESFHPAGLDLRVAVGKIFLKSDGKTFLATTSHAMVIGSRATGVFRVAAGTPTNMLFDGVVCTDTASIFCVASAVASDMQSSAYRSTDGGDSWAKSGAGLPAGGGALGALVSPAPGIVIAGSSKGFFKSVDGGASWFSSTSGFPVGTSVMKLVAAGDAVYAGTAAGLFKSSDAGVTWTHVGAGLPATGAPLGLAFEDGALFVAIFEVSSARAGGIFRSADGGASFTNISGSIPAVRFWNVVATPRALYAGTSSGIFRSRDGGTTWEPFNDGLVFPDTRAVVAAAGTVYQAVYEGESGVYRSTDAGATWLPGDAVIRTQRVTSLAAAGNIVVAGTDAEAAPRGLFRSTDAGATWSAANTGVSLGAGSGIQAVFAAGGTFHAAGYAGDTAKDALYRSTDSGASWSSIGAGIPDESQAGLFSVFAEGSLLLVGGRDGLYRSTDAGATWSSRIRLSPTDSFARVTAFTSHLGALYSGLASDSNSAVGTVHVSRDLGATWSPLPGTLPTSSINALASSDSALFAGTGKGAYRSTDGGASWNVFGVGIGEVRSLALTPASLFVGLRSDGLREVALTPTASRLVPIVLDVDTGAAHFTTELILANTGTTRAAVTLRYTASLGTKQGSGTLQEELPAGRQLVIPDAIAYLRRSLAIPTQGSQGGTLLVTFTGFSDESAVAALARTATATAAPQAVGRAGLAYSGLRPEEGSTGRLTLYGLRSSSSDRSNVAVFSTSDHPVAVKVTAFSGDAGGRSVVVAERLELPAYGWTQFSGILPQAGLVNGYVTIERVSSAGSCGAYGVINDQVTSDGSYVLPVASGSGLLRYQTVPVLVEAGAFLSELVFANRADVEATFDVTYLESLHGAGGGGSARITLAPREQRIVPDALGYLRSRGVSLPPKGSGGLAGALHVAIGGPAVGDTFVGARTAAQSAGGGQFGLFTPGLFGGEEATSTAVTIYGLRADAANRSNVAVFHTGSGGGVLGGDEAISLKLQAYDGDAGGVAKGSALTVILSPGQWMQPAGFFAASGVKNGWVRVTRTGGEAAWGAYGVVNDGAAPGERTGDGAYIPSSF